MKKLLVLAAIVAAVAIAACGGGSDGNNSATAATPAPSGQTVSVKDVGDAGRVLVDSSGQALYASTRRPPAASCAPMPACRSGCR